MTHTTFNIDEKIINNYRYYAKKFGFVMSKKVQDFIQAENKKFRDEEK